MSPNKRMESLPERPLHDEELAPLLAKDDVEEVWVPDHRPRSVATGGGAIQHSGDIMNIWMEFSDRYVAIEFFSPDHGSGLAWYQSLPTHKDEDIAEIFDHTINDFERLSEKVTPRS